MLDCVADAHIGPTAANVAGHSGYDLGIVWMGIACQQCRSRHDLPRLTIAALHHLTVEPGLLDFGACRRRANGLDGRDVRIADAIDRRYAGAGGYAVDMHGACAA